MKTALLPLGLALALAGPVRADVPVKVEGAWALAVVQQGATGAYMTLTAREPLAAGRGRRPLPASSRSTR